MKNTAWFIIIFLVSFTLVSILGIPLPFFLAIFAPILLVSTTYVSLNYNLRRSLEPGAIPKGYESRSYVINSHHPRLYNLGFQPHDTFYLKMIPDVVVAVFKHYNEPIYLCIYHFGDKMVVDVISFFENDITLTTTSNTKGGMFPRPAGKLLQVFENASYEQLFWEHIQACQFMQNQGIKAILPLEGFRNRFMEGLRRAGVKIKEHNLWPLKLLYWSVTKRGREYRTPIEEQYRTGIACMPRKYFSN